jgi:hypothetical protein
MVLFVISSLDQLVHQLTFGASVEENKGGF